jgi:tRNA-dihydrouridine synthase A
MMDHTDRHCRYFLRLISKHALLYTEMITTGAILRGHRERLLAYSPEEHPLAIQLGGSDVHELAESARIAEDLGYDEINLNVGCPSDRVQNGKFGACLMAEPELVAECVDRMHQSVNIPVTIKTRTGIDDRDSYEELAGFIANISTAGCQTFIIHARKAWLNGLSPKENREIPPLQYDTVYQIKKDFPQLKIIINGGFTTMQQITAQYSHVDGVMIGRAAYHDPYLLAETDRLIFNKSSEKKNRAQIIHEFIAYVKQQLGGGVPLHAMTRHILGLYQGQPGSRAFRRQLSENAGKTQASIEVLQHALELTEKAVQISITA